MEVLFSSGFHADPRILRAGNRAVGAWARMLSWLAQWPEETVIPKGVWRMCGATPKVFKALADADLVVESEDGWAPLGEGELWKFYRPASRPRIRDSLRALVMERDEYRCQSCSATENLSLDHILPYSLGGPDTADNLRVLCRSCNSSRGNRVEAD